MTRSALLEDVARPVAVGQSRARVLRALQGCSEPAAVGDIARRVGLHTNTARFHLEGLVRAGVAERTVEPRSTPGRPRTLYRAVAGPQDGRRSYRLLAEILASSLAGLPGRPGTLAHAAGRAWGRFLTDRPAPSRTVDAAAATAGLLAVLDEVGFAPEAVTEGKRKQVLLHHCPFLEAALENREVVCAVHHGLMQGVLEELRAPLTAARLDPFVRPNVCVAHLAARPRNRRAAGARSAARGGPLV
jgi:predicted ArsR family transcriptional regulator